MHHITRHPVEASGTAAPGGPAAEHSRFTFDAIGTDWQIDTDEPLSGSLRHRLLDRIQQFDATYSRFRPDSLVSRIATASTGGRFEFPEDSLTLFDLYDRLVTATGGAVDPLVGRDLELLGYDASYSLMPVPDAVRAEERARGRATWAADIVRDGRTLLTRRGVVIDVGAVGEGYLVDIVSAILREAGIARVVVDAGGDLRHAGERAIRVGLEHPFDPQLVIGVANVRGRALCASGVGARTWGDGLHHLLDARTGRPARKVVATWVAADSAALADGLATALFLTDARRLAQSFDFAYVRMYASGHAEISRQLARGAGQPHRRRTRTPRRHPAVREPWRRCLGPTRQGGRAVRHHRRRTRVAPGIVVKHDRTRVFRPGSRPSSAGRGWS